MLKSIAMTACLALGLAVGGCATHAPPSAATAANDPACVQSTGTRIESPNHKCVGLPGSSYSQEDLQRTGETDAGAALKKMDPRFQ